MLHSIVNAIIVEKIFTPPIAGGLPFYLAIDLTSSLHKICSPPHSPQLKPLKI
jgi:hypothetical protein